MTLQRLILTFDRDAVTVRVLYRTTSGAGPSTKARRREVAELARTGLQRVLRALDAGEGNLEDLGTSGFTTREDILGLTTTSPGKAKRVKDGAA